MHIDQMEKLGLEVDELAAMMADALAVLHWEAKIDADDVELVLGSAPTNLYNQVPKFAELERLPANSNVGVPPRHNFQKRSVHLWLLDFNMCSKITLDDLGVKKAVKAFYRNDPYFPRPLAENRNDKRLWELFSERYMATSKLILDKEKWTLADLFISLLVE